MGGWAGTMSLGSAGTSSPLPKKLRCPATAARETGACSLRAAARIGFAILASIVASVRGLFRLFFFFGGFFFFSFPRTLHELKHNGPPHHGGERPRKRVAAWGIAGKRV